MSCTSVEHEGRNIYSFLDKHSLLLYYNMNKREEEKEEKEEEEEGIR